jgi:hypothetical protein
MKKTFLGKPQPKGWGKRGAPKGNSRAAGRKQGRAFSTRYDRAVEAPPPPIRRGRKRDYLAANCVVLAAAIFGESWAEAWAREMLPMARQIDARRLA